MSKANEKIQQLTIKVEESQYLEKLPAEVESLKQKIERDAEEKTNLLREVSELKKIAAEAEASFKKVSENLARVEKELAMTKSNLVTKQNDVRTLMKTQVELEKQLEENTVKLKTTKNSCEGIVNSYKKELEKTAIDNAKLKEENCKLKEDLKVLA